jgi:hypothetical protein
VFALPRRAHATHQGAPGTVGAWTATAYSPMSPNPPAAVAHLRRLRASLRPAASNARALTLHVPSVIVIGFSQHAPRPRHDVDCNAPLTTTHITVRGTRLHPLQIPKSCALNPAVQFNWFYPLCCRTPDKTLFVGHAKMNIPESLNGPLGSHRNYLRHIAIANYTAYERLKKKNLEEGHSSTTSKYEEFRLFLNAVESFNNVLDYYYFENERVLAPKHFTVQTFRANVHAASHELRRLSELANAYKHCVRTAGVSKNTTVPWAKDLQQVSLQISIDLGPCAPAVEVAYQFEWPVRDHEDALSHVFGFWVAHLSNPNAVLGA